MTDPPEDLGYIDEVCKSRGKFKLLFGFSAAAAGLMLLYVPFVDLTTGTGVVVVMNLIVAGTFATLSGVFLRVCARRQAARERAYRGEVADVGSDGGDATE
jgi:hypothetical protein